MGQVFTWNAVRDGHIPKPEDFLSVVQGLRSVLTQDPSIRSALLFGSVIRGDSNIRSDVDCVVLYETAAESAAMRTMHAFDMWASSRHVPVNFTPCDTTLARTRLHHLGASFIKHLQAAIDAGGLIKGELVGALAPTVSSEDEIESYIKMKMYSVQESSAQMASFTEERLMAFLKKMLEASTHVARKMLIYEGALGGDSKREVQVCYAQAMPSALARQFNQLLQLDSWYSSELVAQIISGPDEERYRRAIRRLTATLPRETLQFLRSNILRLDGSR